MRTIVSGFTTSGCSFRWDSPPFFMGSHFTIFARDRHQHLNRRQADSNKMEIVGRVHSQARTQHS